MCKTLSYTISAEDVKRERQRVAGDLSKIQLKNILKLGERSLPALGPHDVKLEILAVSGEHNVLHAALADIVNPAVAHGGLMYPGNSAVAEVLAVGPEVSRFKPGDIVATHCNAEPDPYGYPLKIWGFDAPGSIGFFSQKTVVGDWQLIHLPLECGLSLWELAALPLRAPTAYHLWRRGIGIFRLKVSRERRARLNVLSFGGGVGELFLMLAKAEGHNAYFCSGTPERLEALAKHGIAPIDQRVFNRFETEDDVRAFRLRCQELTGGENMHIVCDMLRGPVFDAGLSVAARQGTNVSAGWQLSQRVSYSSPLMSIRQVTLDHSHYDTIDGCKAATELYGKVFKPHVHHEIYDFEDLPRCFQHMHENTQTGIPIIQVAKNLPASVQHLGSKPERG